MPNNENRVREGTTCFHAGKNLFSKQNAQLLANLNVITGISFKLVPALSSCICAKCVHKVNHSALFQPVHPGEKLFNCKYCARGLTDQSS